MSLYWKIYTHFESKLWKGDVLRWVNQTTEFMCVRHPILSFSPDFWEYYYDFNSVLSCIRPNVKSQEECVGSVVNQGNVEVILVWVLVTRSLHDWKKDHVRGPFKCSNSVSSEWTLHVTGCGYRGNFLFSRNSIETESLTLFIWTKKWWILPFRWKRFFPVYLCGQIHIRK